MRVCQLLRVIPRVNQLTRGIRISRSGGIMAPIKVYLMNKTLNVSILNSYCILVWFCIPPLSGDHTNAKMIIQSAEGTDRLVNLKWPQS